MLPWIKPGFDFEEYEMMLALCTFLYTPYVVTIIAPAVKCLLPHLHNMLVKYNVLYVIYLSLIINTNKSYISIDKKRSLCSITCFIGYNRNEIKINGLSAKSKNIG